MSIVGAIIRFGLCAILPSFPVCAATCESLASLKLLNTSITVARIVEAGTSMPPGAEPDPALSAIFKPLPAFCRVQAVIQPTPDSHIEFEVWLPVSDWNGKYMGTGKGGFGGSIAYTWGSMLGGANVPGLADLLDGYVTSSTDTGHKATQMDAQWALGYLEKIADYVAPDRIIATKYKTDDDPASAVARTRPPCPYPQVARYKGSGSINDATNFVCRMP